MSVTYLYFSPARSRVTTFISFTSARARRHSTKKARYSMCSTTSARWCGLPPQPPPRSLRCGVLVYLHVPKTGGTAVTQFLLQHASKSGWWFSTVTPQKPWAAIAAQIRKQRRPKHVVIHHVDASIALSNATLAESQLRPLQCWLKSHGCQLVYATTLREASARATSAAFYNRVPQAQYRPWIIEHASNGMISFLLHNRLRLRRRNQTWPMTQQSLQRAQAFLSTFDAIGRTEELPAFISHLQRLLGNGSSSSSVASIRENATPERFKYVLTAEDRRWTQERSALDRQLYESFCSETCPHAVRREPPHCGANASHRRPQ